MIADGMPFVSADRSLPTNDGDAAADLARIRLGLVDNAGAMRAAGAGALEVTATIASAVRNITAKAGVIALTAMRRDGWGDGPPARWSLLVLGSAGRGESLLAFDQDNAIVHEGDRVAELYFAELGRRLADLLDQAGIPYCPGGVMARNREWRHSFAEWETEIGRWVFEPAPETVLSVDIFFDFEPVLGDTALAVKLKRRAVSLAAESPFFLRYLAITAAKMEVPLNLLGGFTTTDGLFNAKKAALLPIVGVARARALAAGIEASGTAARYRALGEKGAMNEADIESVIETHETVLGVLLDRQINALVHGYKPDAMIAPDMLPEQTRLRLKSALRRIRALIEVTGGL